MEQKYKNLDFGDLFVTAFKAMFSNFSGFMAVVVMNLIHLSVIVISAVTLIGMETIRFISENDSEAIVEYYKANPEALMALTMVIGIALIVSIIIMPAAYAANAKLFEGYYLNQKMSFTEAFSYGFSQWTNTFVTILLVILINLGISIGMILIGVMIGFAGIHPIVTSLLLFILILGVFGFIMTKLSFAMPLTVLQGVTPGEAIGDSFVLTKGRFWMVLGHILGGTILISIITGIPSMIFMAMPMVKTSIEMLISLVSGIFIANFIVGLFIRVWEEDHPVIEEKFEGSENEVRIEKSPSDDIQF